jgi:hypothetical protein
MKRIAEQEVIAYHASKENISQFDPEKTGKEFGIHFGSLESAKHRGAIGGTNFFIKKYSIILKNPMLLDDVFKWDVPNVLRNMVERGYLNKKELVDLSKQIDNEAIQNAKKKSSSLSSEKYKILKKILEKMGYDSIVYENKGEAGGYAYIIFDPRQIKEL